MVSAVGGPRGPSRIGGRTNARSSDEPCPLRGTGAGRCHAGRRPGCRGRAARRRGEYRRRRHRRRGSAAQAAPAAPAAPAVAEHRDGTRLAGSKDKSKSKKKKKGFFGKLIGVVIGIVVVLIVIAVLIAVIVMLRRRNRS